MPFIGVEWIVEGDKLFPDRLLEVQPPDAAPYQPRSLAFFSICGDDFSGRAGAAVDLVLKTVVIGRVMAGRYHDGAVGLEGGHSVAGDRCGRRPGKEKDLDAVAGQHLGGSSGEILGSEPCVVAYDYTALCPTCAFQVIGHTLSAGAHVAKGEILGNDGAPAVGAEFDPVPPSSISRLQPLRSSLYRSSPRGTLRRCGRNGRKMQWPGR